MCYHVQFIVDEHADSPMMHCFLTLSPSPLVLAFSCCHLLTSTYLTTHNMINNELDVVALICSPNSREVEAGKWGIPGAALVIEWIWGLLGLCESLSSKKVKPGSWAERSHSPFVKGLCHCRAVITINSLMVLIVVQGIECRLSRIMNTSSTTDPNLSPHFHIWNKTFEELWLVLLGVGGGGACYVYNFFIWSI